MKDVTIPLTREKFLAYLTFILTGISWVVITYYFMTGIPVENTNDRIPFAMAGAGILLGTIFSFIFAGFLYDLNPIHWIGYCLKFKENNC